MSGIFQGLELAKRALLSQQYALTTTGHNIANADTPGYSRQRVNLVATDPFASTVGRVGTGVRVASVRHLRDLFLTGQYRQGSDQLGRWSTLQSALSEVENIMREPSDQGLNASLSSFFNAWQTLSQNPESSAARASVREQASTLVNAFHQVSNRLTDLQQSLDDSVATHVAAINEAAAGLAQLNREIQRTELGGQTANDLRDRRDQMIDELSRQADVRVIEQSNGITRVFLGTMEIVSQDSSRALGTRTVGTGTSTRTQVVWAGSSIEVTVSGGELAGVIAARDQAIPEYQNMLDQLAGAIVGRVNALHAAGYGLDGSTGNNFFDPTATTAARIALSGGIAGDLNRIAASQSGEVGDNANALAIAGLQDALTLNGNTSTFADYYAQIIGTVGTRSREATTARDNASLVLEQIEFSRQSVQGVSLDEEMADLIKSQHAYAAAARVVSAVDRSLDTLINDMGVGL
ncbi:MAG: flagellar hook-associated protein FlgK [Candidatus Zixiibacteriota bacterium]